MDSVELPPPPPPPPPPSMPTGPAGGSTDATESAAPARQRFLTVGWRWVLASGWGMIMASLGLVANTGWLLGGTPFWLPTYVAGFLAPAAVLLAAAADSRHTLRLSWLAVAVTAGLGVIDLFHARAMGLAELLLALAGALLTLAATSGRVTPGAEPAA